MKKIKNILLLLLFVFSSNFSFVQTEIKDQTDLKKKLIELFPNAAISEIKSLEGYSESYQLILDEPLDHKNPSKGTLNIIYIFLTLILIARCSLKHTVLILEILNEVSKLLKANQVAVEYRFYGKSRPNPIP